MQTCSFYKKAFIFLLLLHCHGSIHAMDVQSSPATRALTELQQHADSPYQSWHITPIFLDKSNFLGCDKFPTDLKKLIAAIVFTDLYLETKEVQNLVEDTQKIPEVNSLKLELFHDKLIKQYATKFSMDKILANNLWQTFRTLARTTKLIQREQNEDRSDRTRKTLAHHAAWHGCAQILAEFLEQNKTNSDIDYLQRTKSYETPLATAIRRKNLACQKVLYRYYYDRAKSPTINETESSLQQGSDQDDPDIIITLENTNFFPRNKTKTVLHDAIKSNKMRFLITLAKLFPEELNKLLNDDGRSPIHDAIFYDQPQLIPILKGYGADINKEAPYFSTPLQYAINKDKTDAVKTLLEAGADANQFDSTGSRPLFQAIWHNPELILLMIRYGANPNLPDKNNWTPLQYTIETGKTDAVEPLLKAKADPNQLDSKGLSPLFLAIWHNPELIPLLKQHNADLNLSVNGWTPLQYAIAHGKTKAVKPLLEAGTNPNQLDRIGLRPLFQAIYHNSELIPLLVQYRADLNLLDKNNLTPLEYAITEGKTDAVRILLENGAKNNFNKILQLFFNFINKDNSKGIEVLLKTGLVKTDDERINSHDAPLCYAIRYNKLVAAEMLLQLRADPNRENIWCLRNLPLNIAVNTTNHQAISLLLKYGADPDGTPYNRPLIDAINKNDLEAIELLVSGRADPDLHYSEFDNTTPLNIAFKKNNAEIVRLLLQNSANRYPGFFVYYNSSSEMRKHLHSPTQALSLYLQRQAKRLPLINKPITFSCISGGSYYLIAKLVELYKKTNTNGMSFSSQIVKQMPFPTLLCVGGITTISYFLEKKLYDKNKSTKK